MCNNSMHPQKGRTDEREEQENPEGCRAHRGAGRSVAADGMCVRHATGGVPAGSGIPRHGGGTHRPVTEYGAAPGDRLGRFPRVVVSALLKNAQGSMANPLAKQRVPANAERHDPFPPARALIRRWFEEQFLYRRRKCALTHKNAKATEARTTLGSALVGASGRYLGSRCRSE